MLLQEYIERVAANTHTKIDGFQELKTKYNDVFKIPKIDNVKFEIKLKEITTKSPENTKEKWIYKVTAKSIDENVEKFCENFGDFCVGIEKYKNK